MREIEGSRTGKPLSLERRIRADIEGRIHSGAWPPGHRLPIEADLMRAYRCSRMTVSKALSALTESGLLTRRKKAGTFVARPTVHTAIFDIPDIPAVIRARGEAYAFELREHSTLTQSEARNRFPDYDARGDSILLHGVHFAAGLPLSREQRVISLAEVPHAAGVNFAARAPGSWLLRTAPWTDARHRIAARAADRGDARELSISTGDACLQVERWTWRDGHAITYARQLFPADVYDVVADFKPKDAT
jgi:GntR family histidine utilization transcriptional repressor